MTYMYAALMALASIISFLWGFEVSRRKDSWIVLLLQKEILEEKERSKFGALSEKMVEVAEAQARQIEKLDVSVGNLVMRTFSQVTKVKEKQVGEEDDMWPGVQKVDRLRTMYKPDGFTEKTASDRALDRPT